MEYKEYAFEEDKEVNIAKLMAGRRMSLESYAEAHKNLPILCHDVLIEYHGGVFLLVRDNLPAVGVMWPVGGRVLRGVNLSDSLAIKVREECGLEIENVRLMNVARTYFRTDPFGHGKGTDTINFMFVARGKGEIKLDKLHKDSKIIKREDFNAVRKSLHPYVRDYLQMYFDSVKAKR